METGFFNSTSRRWRRFFFFLENRTDQKVKNDSRHAVNQTSASGENCLFLFLEVKSASGGEARVSETLFNRDDLGDALHGGNCFLVTSCTFVWPFCSRYRRSRAVFLAATSRQLYLHDIWNFVAVLFFLKQRRNNDCRTHFLSLSLYLPVVISNATEG